ncbi:hypothetical protein SCB49_03004 [unidentified eubacterium SCB49]|nr:hypothetical protein SCB49_03004 [unidentified eubacterium SCB49]
MGSKIYRLFEYMYIVMALFSVYLVFAHWGEEGGRSYLFMFFAVLALFMFFFKRRFRKNIDNKDK